jgi:hypothetical protein
LSLPFRYPHLDSVYTSVLPHTFTLKFDGHFYQYRVFGHNCFFCHPTSILFLLVRNLERKKKDREHTTLMFCNMIYTQISSPSSYTIFILYSTLTCFFPLCQSQRVTSLVDVCIVYGNLS